MSLPFAKEFVALATLEQINLESGYDPNSELVQ
jgi:hypothetical protein